MLSTFKAINKTVGQTFLSASGRRTERRTGLGFADRQTGMSAPLWMLGLVLLLLTGPTLASTQIRNVCDLKGSEHTVLNGIGIVVGLDGTGDGEFSSAHEVVLAELQRKLNATATPADLANADSIALVAVRAVVPVEGVRSGVDRLDVSVMCINDAKSLKGGVLLDTALFSPGKDGKIYSAASGNIVLEDDEQPRSAKVVQGGIMVRDIPSNNLDKDNRMTLVLHQSSASWELASYIAQTINGVMVLSEDDEPIAEAKDAKNVVVQVPKEALPNIADFIRQIMVTTIDSELASGGARVRINRKEGTIAMTKDVVLSPVIISHKGMTIQIVTPEPEPTVNKPRVENNAFTAITSEPEQANSPRLRQLLDALNTLKVPAEDRIAIILELHKLGVLHAELEYQ